MTEAKRVTAQFPLGKVLMTPGAEAAMEAAGGVGRIAWGLLARHVKGDWGEVGPEDWRSNDTSVADGTRVLSAYTLPGTDVKVWVITEADRSVTTILLPEEY